MNVSGNNYTIDISGSDLLTDLELRIRVAGVNEYGTGPFNNLVVIVRSELEKMIIVSYLYMYTHLLKQAWSIPLPSIPH